MSLVGLDTPVVVAARQASLAEPSGWFLLKYVSGSRDTIELLQRGSNGVSETKSAVEIYQEKSPLYGMIHFRRRKIVLKYVPDGTSRVLQVRLAVQFQSVLDAFTPHDTLFSFTTASELSESSLALAIMMLPSLGSTSSNSSDRRRRLDEISEDVEDAPEKATTNEPEIIASPVQNPIQETSSNDLDELPASALRARALLERCKDADSSPEPPPPVEPAQPILEETTPEPAPAPARKEPLAVSVPPPAATSVIEKDLPAIPNPSPPASSGPAPSAFPVPPSGASRTAELLAVLEPSRAPLTSASLDHSRHLSATDSDGIQEWSNTVASFNAVKPKKKKLAPRPHVEGPSRPRTSGNSETAGRTHPVANMPSSVRITTNRPTTSATNYRPGSQQSSRSVPGRFPPPESSVHIMPPLPSPTHVASMYRPVSRASRGMSASIQGETANATPEKMRLMKALQLRKRNQLVTQRNSNSTGVSIHTTNESQAGATNNLAEPVTSRNLITPSTASPTTMKFKRCPNLQIRGESALDGPPEYTAVPSSIQALSLVNLDVQNPSI